MRKVQCVFDTIIDILGESVNLIYENYDDSIEIYEKNGLVTKVFRRISDNENLNLLQYKEEYTNHIKAYGISNKYMIPIVDSFYDESHNGCIIYPYLKTIKTREFQNRIEDCIKIIIHYNNLNIYHIDTKIDNFLKNDNEDFILHDFGLCYFLDNLDESTKTLIFHNQIRLLFTGWVKDNTFHLYSNIFNKYNIPYDLYDLPVNTMYRDKLFNELKKKLGLQIL